MSPSWRTLLILGRVSNLPTVWSNCLAGWWLAGGYNYWKLPPLLLGVSLLYTGGMFLNDAFDADFDRQRRSERPIPAGKISADLVWKLGFGQLALGILLLLFCGKVAGLAAVFLALFILLYDFSHKFFTASPWLMGGCRFWVYIIAGATAIGGLNGWVIYCGAALALYIVGLSYVARRETFRGPLPHWPLVLLIAPIVLAMAMNNGVYRRDAVCISVVLALWLARYVWPTLTARPGDGGMNVGWIVSNLLSGIVFVDWLAVVPQIPHVAGGIVFLALFALTKWLQKFVPAT